MGMQNFIKIYQKVQGIGPVSLFSEFEPRQNLDLSQISFDNLIGYILSISVCMQNFITIFFTVLQIGPTLVKINVSAKFYQNIPNGLRVKFHCFQNLTIFTFSEFCARQSLDRKKCHFAISWARSCQYQCLRKSLSKYSTQFKRAIFTFSEIGTRQSLDRW